MQHSNARMYAKLRTQREFLGCNYHDGLEIEIIRILVQLFARTRRTGMVSLAHAMQLDRQCERLLASSETSFRTNYAIVVIIIIIILITIVSIIIVVGINNATILSACLCCPCTTSIHNNLILISTVMQPSLRPVVHRVRLLRRCRPKLINLFPCCCWCD